MSTGLWRDPQRRLVARLSCRLFSTSCSQHREVDMNASRLIVAHLASKALSGLLLASMFCCPVLALSGDQPWDSPGFSADPAAIVQAASSLSVPPGVDAFVLLDEKRYVFDAEGREKYARRLIYKILTSDGARDWSTVGAEWEPWHPKTPCYSSARHYCRSCGPRVRSKDRRRSSGTGR